VCCQPGRLPCASLDACLAPQVTAQLGLHEPGAGQRDAAAATVAVERTRTALAAGHGPAGALTAGYDRAFVVAAVLSLAGLGCSFLIPAAVTAAPSAAERQPQASGQPERR
jgi:hypothetical protein